MLIRGSMDGHRKTPLCAHSGAPCFASMLEDHRSKRPVRNMNSLLLASAMFTMCIHRQADVSAFPTLDNNVFTHLPQFLSFSLVVVSPRIRFSSEFHGGCTNLAPHVSSTNTVDKTDNPLQVHVLRRTRVISLPALDAVHAEQTDLRGGNSRPPLARHMLAGTPPKTLCDTVSTQTSTDRQRARCAERCFRGIWKDLRSKVSCSPSRFLSAAVVDLPLVCLLETSGTSNDWMKLLKDGADGSAGGQDSHGRTLLHAGVRVEASKWSPR